MSPQEAAKFSSPKNEEEAKNQDWAAEIEAVAECLPLSYKNSLDFKVYLWQSTEGLGPIQDGR